MKSILFQIGTTDAASPADSLQQAVQASQELNILELSTKGGVIMIPIVILLAIAIFLIIERWLNIRKAGKSDPYFMANIKDMVINGNISGARMLCEKNNTPIARMLEKGISRIGSNMKNIEVIGFLGTVTGMIKTFFELSKQGDTITAGALGGGIYEAMVTTVAGLIVGLIAYLGFNLLTASIERVVYKMEASTVEFIDILQQPASK
jgi:biopolymer transport protein ExbB